MAKPTSFLAKKTFCRAHGSEPPHSHSPRDWISVVTERRDRDRVLKQLRLWIVILVATFLFTSSTLHAAPKAELWPRWQKHDPADKQKIDHGLWDGFLRKNVIAPHPSGINRVRYQDVSKQDREALRTYLQNLQGLPISGYNRAEQKAFWINLYNALTVELILSRFPVASIRDINISPGLFIKGPWGAKLVAVEGEKLALDDIEHRILRPIWQDSRVHYALNCASLGCPNLQPTAYTGDNTEALLGKAAREFINHPRGVAIKNGKLHVSSIYVWFQADFGAGAEGLMEHWTEYADEPLAGALINYSGGLEHDYDWRLNGAEDKVKP
ncbi:MAG: DUF547 domain-containing protein [Candidatus Binatia bacterium]